MSRDVFEIISEIIFEIVSNNRENVFVIDIFDRIHTIIFLFFYCFSRLRIFLFCFSSNFSSFNETSTKNKKKIFRIFTKFCKTLYNDYAFFCFVSHWIFQILTKHRQQTKNHLFKHTNNHRRYRRNDQINFNLKMISII